MRKSALFLIVAIMALAMAPAGLAEYSTQELNVAIWDNNQLPGLRQIAEEWSQKTGVKVNMQVITWNEYWTLLEAGAMGNNMPDVFWMHINEAVRYMQYDMLLDLTDYIAADDTTDLSNYYEGLNAIYSFNGRQYGLPKDHDTIALIYNKAIFDRYGVDYPTDAWTWDDYAAAAAKITEAGKDEGIYGTAMNTNDGQDGWYNLIYDFGGYLITDDQKTSGMDNENTIAAMTWLADNLFPSMPPQSTMAENDPDLLFMSGKIGMMLQGSWMVNSFYQDDDSADYAWSIIPYYDANGNGTCEPEERCSLYNGLSWSASAGTSDPQAAYDLIAWFCSEAGQLEQSELGVTMAAYIGASDAFVTAFEGMDLTPFLQVEREGTLIQHPASMNTTRWEGQFTIDLVEAWNHPEKMADVCRSLAEKMNQYLAEE